MKWKFSFLLIGLLLLFCSSEGRTDQQISLDLKDAEFSQLIRSIEQQTIYRFVYNSEQVSKASPVTMNVTKASLNEVLEIGFRNQPLQYRIDSVFIIISQKAVTHAVSSQDTSFYVEGRVTNEQQESLSGASVTVKNTSVGTTVDANGYFKLKGVGPDAILVFSSIGYLSLEVNLKGRQYLNVSMTKSIDNLDETVIIGYGQTTRRLSTGSVGKVSAKTIEQQPVSNVIGALQGRVTGVNIIQNTGVPGGAFTVQIRGKNSVAAGNEPLYIIDGVPVVSQPQGSTYSGSSNDYGNPLSNYNPQDIESVEVLKDADATAIYGSRAANGVILITTKKGRTGKINMDGNIRYGAGKVVQRVELLNTSQYLEMRREAFVNDGVIPSAFDAPDIVSWDSTKNTDWQEKILGNTAEQFDANLGVSGGTDQVQFLISGNLHDENTVFPGDFNYRRYNSHYSINYRSPDRKLYINFSGGFGAEKNYLPVNTLSFTSLLMAPNAPDAFDSNGELYWENGFSNPYQYFKQEITTRTNNFLNNLVVGYTFLKGVDFKINLGYNQYNLDEKSTLPSSSVDPAIRIFIPSELRFANRKIHSWVVEPQLNYKHKYKWLMAEFLTGLTLQDYRREGETLSATGFINDEVIHNLSAASTVTVIETIDQKYRYSGIFARINFLFWNRYQLNLTGRRDGSSRFGSDNRFANFGSIAAAWIFTEEKFLKGLAPYLSFGKIRASYGTTGNDQIGDYQYLDSWQFVQYGYQGQPGLRPSRLANPSYRWEVNNKFELATELGFFANRLNIIAARYINRSSNQLVAYSVPLLTGFSQIQQNLSAKIENSGWEFEAFGTLLQKKNFKWDISANLTIPNSKLLDYPSLESSPYAMNYQVGSPLTISKNFYLLGVDPATGEYQFEDADKDGIINNPKDRTHIVFRGQKKFGGILNSFRWKGFELNFHFYYVEQYTSSFNILFYPPGQLANQPTIVLERWQKPGDLSSVQRFTQGYGTAFTSSIYNTYYGDNISNSSFIRLRNLNISYQLPVSRPGIPIIRLYLEAQNLFTITRYDGFDPEVQDPSQFPNLRILAAGVKCRF